MIDKKFNARIVPWWTDDCSSFLNNVFKWFPFGKEKGVKVLEFGGGNSTLYFLGKGVKVLTVESDDDYIESLINISNQIGYKSIKLAAHEFKESFFCDYDLLIFKAKNYSDASSLIDLCEWDFIVNDGIGRKELLIDIYDKNLNSIIILDNVEYCANWGRLDRTSAKPDLIQIYRTILRDSKWRNYIFEQPEGREGHGVVDKSGWESPHRWASAIIWPIDHIFSKLMISQLGFPLVNSVGIDDSDLKSLQERCPFDWSNMKWKAPSFPSMLDLKLPRDFN